MIGLKLKLLKKEKRKKWKKKEKKEKENYTIAKTPCRGRGL